MPLSRTQLPPSNLPREPQLLRFRLRQMFLMVTLASVMCAALVLTEGPWPVVILVAVLLVAAHVMGNLVGTRLRDTSHEVVAWRAQHPHFEADHPVATQFPVELDRLGLPPGTPLASHERIARWTLWFVTAGATVGLIAGMVAMSHLFGTRIEWAGWLVGVLSCGVLGAWAAFLASTFSSIARHAWRHAHERSN